MTEYLFVGGLADGQRIATNREETHLVPVFHGGVIHGERYRCEKLGAMGRAFFVYLHEDLSTYDGLSLLIKNYNPKPSE